MDKRYRVLLACAALMSAIGCSSTYMKNRGNDLMDIVELGVTTSPVKQPGFALNANCFNIVPVGYAHVCGWFTGLGARQFGVLDFQDAVAGPISYDVISLFKDAFISWPEERVLGWLEQYWQKARAAGVPVPASLEEFLHDCDLMGAQRHLKVIGIFARICHRDGKPKYLEDVPRFFAYLRTVITRRPELAVLGEILDGIGA